jgi:hypothetical protein
MHTTHIHTDPSDAQSIRSGEPNLRYVNPVKFFPCKSLHRYDWKNPRFSIESSGGSQYLVVSVEDLTTEDPILDCLKSTADAWWLIECDGARLAYDATRSSSVDESFQVTLDAALKIGRKGGEASLTTLYHSQHLQHRAAIVACGDDSIRIPRSPIDMVVPRDCVKSVEAIAWQP